MEKSFDNFAQPSSFDIKKYILKLLAYWYLFIISIVLAWSIAFIRNRFIVYTYGIHATVLLKNAGSDNLLGVLPVYGADKNTQNEIGVLASASLNRKVIEELDFRLSYYKYESFRSDVELYKNQPFNVILDSSSYQTTGEKIFVTLLTNDSYKLEIEKYNVEKTVKFGEKVIFPDLNFKIELNPSVFNPDYLNTKYFFVVNDVNGIINYYTQNLKVDLSPEGSSILWLWMVGTVPQKDADYLNKLVEVYIRQALTEKNAVAVILTSLKLKNTMLKKQ